MTPTPCTPQPNGTTPRPCAAFESVVQAVLDRERPLAALADDHTAECTACRELAASARLFLAADLTTLPVPPPDLTDRILTGVTWDTRVQRKRRVAAGAMAAALAASVVAAGVYLTTRGEAGPEPAPMVRIEPAPNPAAHPPVRVADQFADAGSALVAITSRVTDHAVTPTRSLLSPPEIVSLTTDVDVLSPMPEPVADSLAAMPQAAGAGLEPVAATTRRAVNLFFRDFGMSPPAKPNS